MTATASTSKLFQPIKVGRMTLSHRIVLAPMTRVRTTRAPGNVPLMPMVKEYYTQRASTPGTLLITEATTIAPKAAGTEFGPGIWSEEQAKAWKEVVDSVHAQKSYIFLQIVAVGRGAKKAELELFDPSYEVLSSTNTPLKDGEITRAMTKSEIHEFVQLWAKAARIAIDVGFDGVENHFANGFLVDQFLQDVCNDRTDEYGGSVENRARFALEILTAVTEAVGQDRTSVRFSPWNIHQEMKMANPVPQFAYTVSKIKELFPNLAYLHIVEPRIAGGKLRKDEDLGPTDSSQFLRDIWSPKVMVSAGGYTREVAIQTADEKGGLIAFGKYFTSNPDLPYRLKADLPLTPYDRPTFYAVGQEHGYIDFPVAKVN